jgi:D-sedoheptulose 7-phosphate isomerase
MTGRDPQDARTAFVKGYAQDLQGILSRLPWTDLARALAVLERARAEDRQVFIAGNGGSAATASHMANDLMKGAAAKGGRPFRAIALSDNVPLITAIANDVSYAEVFASQLEALARPGDVLVLFSGSGNSPNILRAAEVAKAKSLATIGFLGMGGGKARAVVDVAVVVPSNDYGPVEIIHSVFDHLAMCYFRDQHGGVGPS